MAHLHRWQINAGCLWKALVPPHMNLTWGCLSVLRLWLVDSPRASDPIGSKWKLQWLWGASLKSYNLYLHNELLILEVVVMWCRSGLHKGTSNRKWESFRASTWELVTTVLPDPSMIQIPSHKQNTFTLSQVPRKSHPSTSLTLSPESCLLNQVRSWHSFTNVVP